MVTTITTIYGSATNYPLDYILTNIVEHFLNFGSSTAEGKVNTP